MDLAAVQARMIKILMNIIEGDVTEFYKDSFDEEGEQTFTLKPLKDLTPEQRMCVEELSKGKFGYNYKIHSKVKAMDTLSRLTGLNTVNHVLSVDDEAKPKINFNISFVSKEDLQEDNKEV